MQISVASHFDLINNLLKDLDNLSPDAQNVYFKLLIDYKFAQSITTYRKVLKQKMTDDIKSKELSTVARNMLKTILTKLNKLVKVMYDTNQSVTTKTTEIQQFLDFIINKVYTSEQAKDNIHSYLELKLPEVGTTTHRFLEILNTQTKKDVYQAYSSAVVESVPKNDREMFKAYIVGNYSKLRNDFAKLLREEQSQNNSNRGLKETKDSKSPTPSNGM